MKDVGIDAAYVATVLSFHSLALAGFKFLTGFLYDRFGLRFTMTVCDMAAISVMLILAILTNSALGRTLAFAYGILSSMALPLETIMLPILANDIFGEKSYNKVLGLFVSINTAGYAIGAPLANWTFDTCGSYKPMFYVCCFIMMIITIVFQYVITVSHHHRQDIINKEAF